MNCPVRTDSFCHVQDANHLSSPTRNERSEYYQKMKKHLPWARIMFKAVTLKNSVNKTVKSR